MSLEGEWRSRYSWHCRYVGTGMLSGAVAGNVFASPPTASVLAAIRALAQQADTRGCLVDCMSIIVMTLPQNWVYVLVANSGATALFIRAPWAAGLL